MASERQSPSDPERRVPGLPADALADLFRSLATSCPDGIVVADRDGRIAWANRAAHDMFRYDPGTLTGRPVTDLVPEELAEDARTLRRRVLAGEEVRRFVSTGLRADGSRFPFALTPAARSSTEGQVLGLNAIIRDLTEEHQVRDDLAEALARAHARFDQVAKAQVLLDLDARIIAVNDAGCRLIGRERADLLGREARSFLEPAQAPETAARIDLVRSGELDATSFEGRVHPPHGASVPVLVDLSLVRSPDGSPRELAAFATDLTDVHEARARLRERDAFFGALYRRSADPALVVDGAAVVRYVSPAFTRVLGHDPADVLGRSGFDLLHPDDHAEARRTLTDLVTRHRSSARLLIRVRTADGEWRWLDAQATNCLDDPVIEGIVVNVRDVTSEVEARDRLRESETRYRTIVETAQEGIIAIDTEGNVIFANEKLAQVMGLTLENVYRNGVLCRFTPEQQQTMRAKMATRAQVGAEQLEVDYVHPRLGSTVLSVSVAPFMDDDGRHVGSLGMVSDITLERQVRDELRRAAMHDSLTGLPNRALLEDRLEMAEARQHREHTEGLAVLFLDLDHFKVVNDTHGHAAGDALLETVAERLMGAVRETDTVARIGGDEFAVVCEDAWAADAEAVAERIQTALVEPFEVAGESVRVGVSIGIALSPPHRAVDLLRFADQAMYVSKTSGRGLVTSYDVGRSECAERRAQVVDALRGRLAEGLGPLSYRLIVSVDGKRVLGLEAVSPWGHPTLGQISPEEVSAAAETAGISSELDAARVAAAAGDLTRLRGQGAVDPEVYVAVPVSWRSVRNGLSAAVEATLEEVGLPASCLSLGLAEAAPATMVERDVSVLADLRGHGLGVAVDAVGSAHGSLVQLGRLPVDTLRLDSSIVAAVTDEPSSRVIARSVADLADALGIDSVATGVDTEEQLVAMRALGYHAVQGDRWGDALPMEELPAVLARFR